jgi:UDP-sugar transporter A1/2/3
MLAIGSAVTQLTSGGGVQDNIASSAASKTFGYTLVIVNAFASGMGGVSSEKLLKGGHEKYRGVYEEESIHRQNMQLYFFGIVFGALSFQSRENGQVYGDGLFHGFNGFAWATVASLSACGLTVSFILKYLDNIAKCFVAALAMLCVTVLDTTMKHEGIPLRIILGIVLTCLALEQYHLS